MEDKEREAYFQLINQLTQYNVQLTMNMMNMFTSFMTSLPSRMPSIPTTMSFPMPGTMSPNLGAFIPTKDDIDKIMKSMFGMKSDDKDLT